MKGARVVARVLAVALALVAGGEASAQNLLVNADFDLDLSGWTIEGTGSASHDPTEGSPEAPLGSARLTLSAVTTAVHVSLRQCFAIGDGPFDFGGRFYVGGSILCRPSIELDFFDSANCEGTWLSNIGALSGPPDEAGVPGTYFHWRRLGVAKPAGAVSARFSARASGMPELAGSAFCNARFDRLYLGPPGTTPVELRSFSIE